MAGGQLFDEIADPVADDHDVFGGFRERPSATAVLDTDGAFDDDRFVDALLVDVLNEVDESFRFADEDAPCLGAAQKASDKRSDGFCEDPGFDRRKASSWCLQDGELLGGEREDGIHMWGMSPVPPPYQTACRGEFSREGEQGSLGGVIQSTLGRSTQASPNSRHKVPSNKVEINIVELCWQLSKN